MHHANALRHVRLEACVHCILTAKHTSCCTQQLKPFVTCIPAMNTADTILDVRHKAYAHEKTGCSHSLLHTQTFKRSHGVDGMLMSRMENSTTQMLPSTVALLLPDEAKCFIGIRFYATCAESFVERLARRAEDAQISASFPVGLAQRPMCCWAWRETSRLESCRRVGFAVRLSHVAGLWEARA